MTHDDDRLSAGPVHFVRDTQRSAFTVGLGLDVTVGPPHQQACLLIAHSLSPNHQYFLVFALQQCARAYQRLFNLCRTLNQEEGGIDAY